MTDTPMTVNPGPDDKTRVVNPQGQVVAVLDADGDPVDTLTVLSDTTITITLEKELYDKAVKLAHDAGITIEELVIKALEEFIAFEESHTEP